MRKTNNKIIVALLGATALSACGGGGGVCWLRHVCSPRGGWCGGGGGACWQRHVGFPRGGGWPLWGFGSCGGVRAPGKPQCSYPLEG